MPTWLYFCCIIVYIPGQGVCIQVLLSRLCPLQTFPGLHVRVLVCKLFPQVAPQGPNGVHWVKFSSPFPSTAFLAASMDDLYSSFSRRCSISEKKIKNVGILWSYIGDREILITPPLHIAVKKVNSPFKGLIATVFSLPVFYSLGQRTASRFLEELIISKAAAHNRV